MKKNLQVREKSGIFVVEKVSRIYTYIYST